MGQRAVGFLDRVPAPVAARFRRGGHLARLVAPALERALPERATVVTIRSGPARGLRLLVDPQREKYYWTGAFEPAVQQALVRLLVPGATFWDVGAHAGFFTVLASRLVGPSGRVHAFEPVPANCARLAHALELNDCGNVTVHATAVAERPGAATLFAAGSSSMWTLAPRSGADAISVECTTLDRLADCLDPPDVVKIDAEGAETAILRGGGRLLRTRRPAIVVELHGAAGAPGYRSEHVDDRHVVLRADGGR